MEKDIEFVKEITSKEKDFSQWYVGVVRKAELADHAIIKSCMAIRPYEWNDLWGGVYKLVR